MVEKVDGVGPQEWLIVELLFVARGTGSGRLGRLKARLGGYSRIG